MNGMRNKKLYTGCRKCESRFSCPDAYMEHSHKCNNYEKESEVKSMGDVIHKPDHYCFSEYEPRKVIHSWGLNFNLGNAVKYICRAGRKGDILEDLKKAKEYLTFEIEEIEIERGIKPEGIHIESLVSMTPKEFIEAFRKDGLIKLNTSNLIDNSGNLWVCESIDTIFGCCNNGQEVEIVLSMLSDRSNTIKITLREEGELKWWK